jgi:hypothetical protein
MIRLFRQAIYASLVTLMATWSVVVLAQAENTDAPPATTDNAGEPVASVEATTEAAPVDTAPISDQVEDLKQAALNLNRDLLLLEEELLFPGNTQVAVFVSMDVGEFFQLDAVKVKIDDKVIGSHLYTERQINALFRGGIQRIYVGNVKSGQHEISAFFTGKGPAGRDYKRAAKLTFEKTSEPALLELRIVDSTQKLQPIFDIKEWELP